MNAAAKLTRIAFSCCLSMLAATKPLRAGELNQDFIDTKCLKGPKRLTIEGQAWDLFRCDDEQSLAFVSTPESPSYPFFFLVNCKKDKCTLHGQGTGNKAATDMIYNQLQGVGPEAFKFLQGQIPQ
jgi:hypothetical protein